MRKMNTRLFYELPKQAQAIIEHGLIKECTRYLSEGDSVSVSVVKAVRSSPLARKSGEMILRSIPELKNKLREIHLEKINKPRGFA
jgi:hypothetical protein